MSARSRSGVRGVAKLRRTLRRLDGQITKGLRLAIEEGSQAVVADAIARVPFDEGDLARSISYKLGRDGLTSIIGPAAKQVAMVGGRTRAGAPFATGARRVRKLSRKNKAALFEFFKGYWLEFGTKGSPARNIPPVRARPFMGPAWDINRAWMMRRVQRALAKALARASRQDTRQPRG